MGGGGGGSSSPVAVPPASISSGQAERENPRGQGERVSSRKPQSPAATLGRLRVVTAPPTCVHEFQGIQDGANHEPPSPRITEAEGSLYEQNRSGRFIFSY